jgi:hypothetical protein
MSFPFVNRNDIWLILISIILTNRLNVPDILPYFPVASRVGNKAYVETRAHNAFLEVGTVVQLFEEQDERSVIRLVSIMVAEEVVKVANLERRVQPEFSRFLMIVECFVMKVVIYVVENESLEILKKRRPRFQ